MDMANLFFVSQEDSVAVLEAGAAANPVGFSRLARHNRILGKYGIPRATTFPSEARFRFGDGRLGEVRHEADISLGGAGNRGKFTAFAPEANIPAFSRKGAMEALGG